MVSKQSQVDTRHIVVFDGVCNFCNSSVNFIIKRDPEGVFAFTPIQSELAKALMKQHNINSAGIDTLMLIKNDQCYVYSDAALEITKDLTGFWYLFNGFRLMPATIRDFIYKIFARNRYVLFGKKDSCLIPQENVRARFVGL